MHRRKSLAAAAAAVMAAGAAALALCGAAAPPAAAAASAPAAATASPAPITPTDYSDGAHWLHVANGKRYAVDVFYVYPTAYSRTDPSQPVFCPVDDLGMMQGAQAAYTRQAWAFRTLANIYAPYYRQVDAKYQLPLPPKEQEANIEGPPGIDVTAAFKYYLKHYNKGRPFILAGHSQGSAVLRYLLASYLKEHPRVYKRMVAAYIVGQSITPSYLRQNPHLKYARRAGDTGVVISWNTEAPRIAAPNSVLLKGGIAMNPITWTRKQTRAKAQQNPGSIELDLTTGMPLMTKQGRILRVKRLADARVDRKKGVVVCATVPWDKPPYFTPGGFPEGVLHSFDYPLYFFSIRQNATLRAQRYLAAH